MVTGQVIDRAGPAGAVSVSAIDRPVTVTLPVFFTANEYETVCPAAVTLVGVADLVSVNAALVVAVTVAEDGADVTAAPVGGVPDAVAVLVTDPASRSAWVTA